MGNHVLCPPCFLAGGRYEEKACGHGTIAGYVCRGCRKARLETDPFWHCLGSTDESDPPPAETP